MDIVQKLDELSELQTQSGDLHLDYEGKRAGILSAVQAQLDDLEREYRPKLDAVQLSAAQLEGEIKTLVIQGGVSVKGTRLHAIYTKGRVTWDSKKLDGLMIAFPQLVEARREGEPSISIRVIK